MPEWIIQCTVLCFNQNYIFVFFKVASAGKAGNSSFSFAMEISGVVLKRSNFQLFFQDKEGRKTDLVQVRG